MAEPIKELITQNLEATLKTITEQAGYFQTLDVKRSDPAGVTLTPWATYLFELDDTADAPPRMSGKICWVAPYQIGVFAAITNADIAGQVITRLEADIQKAVMADLRRGGKAWNTYWIGCQRATNEAGELVGTICTVHVHYRTKETDPYSL
jgi:hypothetical protein